MKTLICTNVYVPLRKYPSHKSEQGSQILFGEKYEIIERLAGWLRVINMFDGYSGWIDGDHHQYIEDSGEKAGEILAIKTEFTDSEGNSLLLEPGSELLNVNHNDRYFVCANEKYLSETSILTGPPEESIIETASRFINTPYSWGGRVSSGMDCSGFTQLVYKLHGIKLPRDSFAQAEEGITVSFINEAAAGDLVFFDNERGKINHVGLIADSSHIIHCSGKVKIDRIDHLGIYNEKTGSYTHSLRTIKRIQTGRRKD